MSEALANKNKPFIYIMYDIPILFIFFNRLEVAQKTFERIREARPSRLYLAQDGFRKEKGEPEASKILHIRQTILSMIDWDCEVKTLFRQSNVGCGMGVKTAIDWMFENEDFGIILEDDCVVNPSFWPYMSELLSKYASDQRIGMIAGYNPLSKICSDASYTFSRYKACWGWATWRRAWKQMDIDMKWRTGDVCDSVINNMGGYGRDHRYWTYRLKAIDHNYVSAWDWQWYFTLASQNQLCIFPSCNLVDNIGFGDEATHTTQIGASRSADANAIAFPLKHPDYILPNRDFDRCFYKHNNTLYNSIIQRIPFPVKRWIKAKMLNR